MGIRPEKEEGLNCQQSTKLPEAFYLYGAMAAPGAAALAQQ